LGAEPARQPNLSRIEGRCNSDHRRRPRRHPLLKAKVAQEDLIRRSGVPWTIVRATQFHPYLSQTFARSARFGIVPCLKFPVQPVDPREVSRVLAETAEADPLLRIAQLPGRRC
jgi:uncharacterized protein YbjT (DUF2867 family)